jgi:hypothetical protein
MASQGVRGLFLFARKQTVPRDGIEPTTPAFSVLCSTN